MGLAAGHCIRALHPISDVFLSCERITSSNSGAASRIPYYLEY